MVGVAQLVERRVVVADVAGSSPVTHPKVPPGVVSSPPFSDYSQRMSETQVLRRFNRTYTQRIGALDESFLGLGLPLGAARLVFEIGLAGATVRDLRGRLGLDSGHLA